MQIGVKAVDGKAVVFGWDDDGAALFPDLGVEGYDRLVELVVRRRQPVGEPVPPTPRGLLLLLEAMAEGGQPLPDLQAVVETQELYGRSTFTVHDACARAIAGPFASPADVFAWLDQATRVPQYPEECS
ncbi:hypothetical protein ASG43_19000 [Aureimonas sp. Leaf454]|uniref:hypothetical protein n=1 Tax=Aureimonas sp. Leaf454 TaxID=1736381 RepID=UPI0006FE9B0F|nr:hypothetical protein [Aureimonas sp. Leaf454]KQT53302.1 hypothetical protein ASG43_19000 [Aureimonas sp. Leaf454]